jgi:hypothetical protein
VDALLSLLTGSNGLLVGLGAILAVVFGAWARGRVTGAAAERQKQASREAKARTVADEVDNDVGAMPPQDAREALKKWDR